ncbi:MAG: CobW family GTP-binding protein, partial [Stellaceae bacterium]
TVLNHLVKQPALSDTVVIINEFGEIALDHLLIERTSENIALLRSGCICCAVRGDLIDNLRDLAAQRDAGAVAFSRVIIETTGLADPAPILHTLMVEPAIASHYSLEGVVTTVDAVNGFATLDAHGEAVKQAAMADRILLTKCDLAPRTAIDALIDRLQHLNHGAPILDVTAGRIEPRELVSIGPYDPAKRSENVRQWLHEEAGDRSHAGEHGHHDHRHDDAVRTHSVTIDAPVHRDAFAHWIELIAAMRGEQLLRLKGIVAEHPDRPLVIHGVQHVIHPVATLDAWPSEDRRTRLVFITRDLPADLIERTLTKFAEIARDRIVVA